MVARVGRSIGLGHWGRSLNLAKEFSKRSHRVYLEAIPVDTGDELFLPKPYLESFDGNIDIQIIDDPLEPLSLVKQASLRISIDFFKDPNELIHIAVNAIDRTPVNIKTKSNIKRLVGMEYLLVDSESDKFIKLNTSGTNLLFIMGGKDILNLTLPVLKILNESNALSKMKEIKIIVGADHPEWQSIKNYTDKIPNSLLLPIQASILPLLQWSNLVVCNGGMIAMLTILQKRDAVFIPQAKEEEELLAALLVNPDQIVPLKDHGVPHRILNAFNVALRNPELPKLSIDGKGCARVVDIALQIFNKKN
jgi:spore coat polysaccharide biosynthesis predicted glycosyltransferase SpsG